MKLNFKNASQLEKDLAQKSQKSTSRLLLVDDEIENLEGLKRQLEEHYQVFACSSCKEAFGLIEKEAVDGDFAVIISDQMMPVMTGVEFFKELKKMDHQALRIIFTGFAALDQVVEAVNDAGIFRYLRKPVAQEDLLRVVGEGVTHYEMVKENKRLLDSNHQIQQEIEALNADLERQVVERTRTINNILNFVKSGFLVINRKLAVTEGFTASCQRIIGKKIEVNGSITDILGLVDRERDHFEAAIGQVFDDVLPESVALGNLENRYKVGDKTISMEGAAIRDDQGTVNSILFTLNDVTMLCQIEAEAHNNKTLINILNFKDSFKAFLHETSSVLNAAKDEIEKNSNSSTVRPLLHTAKGNCSSFGLRELARLIHSIEDEPKINREHVGKIERSLQNFLEVNKKVLGIEFDGVNEESFEVCLAEFNAMSQYMEGYKDKAATEFIRKWILDVTSKKAITLLGPIHETVHLMAEKLHKDVDLVIIGGDIRVNTYLFGDILRSSIHLIHNSIDHGFEAKAGTEGGRPKGTISMQFEKKQNGLTIIFADDGIGINIEKIKEQVVALGLADVNAITKMKDDDVAQFIFHGGLTTVATANAFSGRGLGMKALRDAVEKVGGTITVKTTQGQGTCFTIFVPDHHFKLPTARAA